MTVGVVSAGVVGSEDMAKVTVTDRSINHANV